jgi:hypothetical protein
MPISACVKPEKSDQPAQRRVFYGHKRLQDMLNRGTARLGVLRLAVEPRGLADVWLEVMAEACRAGRTREARQ